MMFDRLSTIAPNRVPNRALNIVPIIRSNLAFQRMRRLGGFSLIEAIVFIVVLAVLLGGLVVAFTSPLGQSPQAGQLDMAAELAQQRMELILAQRRAVGFVAFADPCPGPAICTPPAGYAVSSSIVGGWTDPANFKIVTVNVTGLTALTVTALVANY